MLYNMDEMMNFVEKSVDYSRFIHTIGVRDTSFLMATVHGIDETQALVAGLLHDNAKCLSSEVLLSECIKYKLSISEDERKAPYLLHGKLGAYYAQKEFSILNDNILNAISYHTTGRPNMSPLEKIVFVADYIEPGRKSHNIANMKEIRKLAFSDLDKAVYLILRNTIDYLTKKQVPIDKTSIEAYDYYSKFSS